ncbi:MAG: hypothetical protein JWO60_1794, partial [Frankiales bacterium]|nr:hypothetical protein [Frankiales bacterium]
MSAGPRDTQQDPTSGRSHGDDGHPGRAQGELAGD